MIATGLRVIHDELVLQNEIPNDRHRLRNTSNALHSEETRAARLGLGGGEVSSHQTDSNLASFHSSHICHLPCNGGRGAGITRLLLSVHWKSNSLATQSSLPMESPNTRARSHLHVAQP